MERIGTHVISIPNQFYKLVRADIAKPGKRPGRPFIIHRVDRYHERFQAFLGSDPQRGFAHVAIGFKEIAQQVGRSVRVGRTGDGG